MIVSETIAPVRENSYDPDGEIVEWEWLIEPEGRPLMLYLYYNTGSEQPPSGGDENNITARFVIEPNTIEFRETFTLRPIEIDTGSCTYTSHRYLIEGPNRNSQTPIVSNKTQSSTFTYSNYPSAVTVGSHTVYIKVFTRDCGETDWISPETLTVTEPAGNNPPVFQVAWVDPVTWEPVTTVQEGRTLHLVLIEDPPPYDPDGDPIHWEGFDTAGSLDRVSSAVYRLNMMNTILVI